MKISDLLSDYKNIEKEIVKLNKYLYDNPELGYEEIKSSTKIKSFLKEHKIVNNFKEFNDIPTAFVGSLNNKKGKNIAICIEYDALPEIGHACGHNLITSMGVGAMYLLSKFKEKLNSEILIVGCPAEEIIPLTFENGGQFIVGDVGFVAADGQPAGPYNGKGDVAITGRIIYLPSGGQISLGEKTISPRDAEEVVFDEREAKAVAEYIKAHLQREVDKDLNMYQSHSTQYQKERQEIYRERREYKPTSLTNPYPVSTATVGPYQVN